MAEESTDGEVETQVYNQDSQDSIGEVRTYLKYYIVVSPTEISFVKWKHLELLELRFIFTEILLDLTNAVFTVYIVPVSIVCCKLTLRSIFVFI